MNKQNFLIGMGLGLAVGSLAVVSMTPSKKSKNVVGKALKTMGEVVDTVSGSLGL